MRVTRVRSCHIHRRSSPIIALLMILDWRFIPITVIHVHQASLIVHEQYSPGIARSDWAGDLVTSFVHTAPVKSRSIHLEQFRMSTRSLSFLESKSISTSFSHGRVLLDCIASHYEIGTVLGHFAVIDSTVIVSTKDSSSGISILVLSSIE